MKTDLLAMLQRLTPRRRLWLSVMLAVLITEAVVSVMGLLLKGEVPSDYLLTGLAASLFAASVVTALLNILFAALQQSVTEHNRTEEELRIAAIAFESQEGMIVTDAQGVIVRVNRAFTRLTGYSTEEAVGQTPALLKSGRHDQAFYRQMWQTLVEKRYWQGEVWNKRKNGNIYAEWLTISAVAAPDGTITHYIGTFSDITERMQAAEMLRKSAEEIADLYHHAPCGYHSLDQDGIFQKINDTELAWLGYTRDEVVGKMKWINLLTSAGIQTFRETFPRLMKQGFIHDLEVEITRKNGTTFNGLINATAIYDTGGNFVMSRSTVTDITARKRMEAVVRRSGERARLAIGASHLALWDYDLATGGVYLSEGWSQFLGGDPRPTFTTIQELSGLVPEEERDMVRAAIMGAVKGRESSSYQVTHRAKKPDGEYIWVFSEGRVVERDRNGWALRMIGTNRDITERKQAEQALRQQKNLIRQIIDADPNMISVKDAEGKFLVVNQAMAAMHGMSPEELVGQSGAEQFWIKENASVAQADREVIETLRKVELVTHDFRNGKDRWFHVTKVPMMQPDGTAHVLGIGVEITEKRLAEQQLRELTAHIQTVREEEKAHIARELHDDLGGTLTALKMEIYWLTREAVETCWLVHEATEGKDAPMLERIEAVSQLLDSAVSVTRRVITELHPTILDDLGLLAALEWQAGRFQKRTGIECRVVCAIEGRETGLDKTQAINLFRIFQETLTNVARHSGASRVEVEFHHCCEIVLSIRDNGCGLPEGHTIASTSYGMRGMTERVKQLGGKIKFDSPPGGGLEVTVKLPADNENGYEA